MSRRRRYTPDWPQDLDHRRKRLGRVLLFAALGLFLAVQMTRTIQDAPDPAGAPATATPAVAPATAASAIATLTGGVPDSTATAGPLALEARADGWYLARPEAWPLVSVDRIVDGDTLDVSVSGVALRVRVFGVDTPERGERCFREASDRLAAVAGREVRLVPDARQQDRFGRELRYLFTPDGRSVDAALLDAGVARAWRDDGALRDALVAIEEDARAEERGCLWAQ